LHLMLLATIFNVNSGVALFPMQLLFCKFFVVVSVVVGFIVDVPDPGVMQPPPRKPGTKIVNRPQIIRWLLTGLLVAVLALCALAFGPDKPRTTEPSISMTMAFAVVAFSAVNLGLVMRREREAPWASPVFSLPRVDHPRMAPHMGRRRAPHAATPPRHRVADRPRVGDRGRGIPHHPSARLG
jgi:Ca2+-transporting ATPase